MGEVRVGRNLAPRLYCCILMRFRLHVKAATPPWSGRGVLAAILAIAGVCNTSSVGAQARDAPAGLSYDVSATPFHQPAVDVEGGGEFSLSSALLRFKVKRAISPGGFVGLSLKYDLDDYDFTGTRILGGTRPWNDIRRFGVGLPFFTLLRNEWSLGLTPSFDWLQEEGADDGDSLSYGVSTFMSKIFARDKSLGLGAGIFRTVEDETKAFPFLAVDWRLTERWRLANPFEADALGPAGLELSYSLNDRWQLGGGGTYRSFQFRLSDKGGLLNGTGSNTGIVGFLRLRRAVTSGLQISFYSGAILNGKLELKGSGGAEVASAEYDTAPFAAVTVSGEF